MHITRFRCKYTAFSIWILIILICCSGALAAQNWQVSSPTYRFETMDLRPDTNQYLLKEKPLIAGTEKVLADTLVLTKDSDYLIDYQQGKITLLRTELPASRLSIGYNLIPNFLLERYVLYELKATRDSLNITSPRRQFQLFNNDNRLSISGSKTFSLTFSNQESFDLKQSLYIKLQGELSPNMKIEGQLSDSQSPLTPEGDSRELSSLDQVFLKLYGRQYAVSFGDLEWQFENTQLMSYQARFEGINLWYRDKHGLQGALAVGGGKSTTNIFQGVDGKQGPYYLYANTNTQTVLVVPGSEQVSINGQNLSRGTDYSIEYSEGSLTFVTLITSNSRIVVDFQFTDDYYRQNMYLNSSLVSLSPKLRFQHHLIWQKDDKGNPLQWTFSAADLDSLQHAGDGDVWGEGVIAVDPGKGYYLQKTDDNGYIYYEYAPNDTTANYLIYFSYVGYGHGDYEPLGESKYRFVGQSLGSWLPQKRLIAPTDKANLGVDLSYLGESLELSLEGMYSHADKNTFSPQDEGDNAGLIIHSSAVWHPEADVLQPRISLTHQQRLEHSFSFSNLSSGSDSYEFASLPAADSLAQTQTNLTGEIALQDLWKQMLSLQYKRVKALYEQRAVRAKTNLVIFSGFPTLDWYASYSQNSFLTDILKSSALFYHNLQNSWKYRLLTLQFNQLLQQENFDFNQPAQESSITGRKYSKINPSVKFGNEKNFAAMVGYAYDKNSQKTTEQWTMQKYSDTWLYNQLLSSPDHTLNLSFTHRQIGELPTQQSLRDMTIENKGVYQKSAYDLFDVKTSHQLWDRSVSLLTAYQLNQLEFFPKVRELQYIGDGLGMYDSTGVAITEGDYDWVYINSGDSKLSTEINANATAFFHLSEKYSRFDIWKRLQAELIVQLTENTLQKNDYRLYLLFPDEIYQESSTLYGRQLFQQTLWYDLWRHYANLKTQIEVNRTLDNRYQSLSKTVTRNIETELELKQVFGSQVRLSYSTEYNQDSRYGSNVSSQILEMTIFHNLSTSAYTQWTLSRQQENGDNQSQSNPYILHTYKLNPSVNIFFNQRYRFSSNLTLQHNQRSGSDFLAFLPDKRDGYIMGWSLQAQYKISSFTSGIFEYSGKSNPGESTIHELKMEFRAEL